MSRTILLVIIILIVAAIVVVSMSIDYYLSDNTNETITYNESQMQQAYTQGQYFVINEMLTTIDEGKPYVIVLSETQNVSLVPLEWVQNEVTELPRS